MVIPVLASYFVPYPMVKLPFNPAFVFFFSTILIIPTSPSASYFADGLLITSILSICEDGIASNTALVLDAVIPDGFPLINTQ